MDVAQISKILSNPSWDLIVLFFFIAAGFFYGISAGKSKLVSFLVSLYVSGFLFEKFYYLGQFIKTDTLTGAFMARVAVFLVILFAVNLLFSRVLRLSSEGSEKKWWQALLISFLSAGLLFSYLFHLFPAKEVFTFSPVVRNFFASDSAFFWWLVLPLVALFLARR